MSDQIEALRLALWQNAQALSQSLSDHTTDVYNQTVATRPDNVWSSAAQDTDQDGSYKWSGSIGPGTFVTNGLPPTSSGSDGTGGVEPIP